MPSVLALPFLWNVSEETLKSRYRVELHKEEAETWTLVFTPLTEADRSWFTKAYLQLDRTTYPPDAILWSAPTAKPRVITV